MYNPKSLRAEEFIAHEEVLETLAYAEANKENRELIDAIIAKARLRKGLSHREAALLLDCTLEEKNKEIYALAEQIKKDYYGNRIVMFAPLYLSNHCINGCVYCPYHQKNTHIARKKLTQEEVAREVRALQDMGHKRLAIESGEDPIHSPIEYILECINTIYSVKHKNGSIRRVNVNIAATTVENYRKLRDAEIGTYILFQETYHKESYEKLHPTGPKHNYAYHTEAMDRAMEGGIDDVGIGVLFGLELYRYEFAALLMHAEHLEAAQGVGPHTISVPRIRQADGIDPGAFSKQMGSRYWNGSYFMQCYNCKPKLISSFQNKHYCVAFFNSQRLKKVCGLIAVLFYISESKYSFVSVLIAPNKSFFIRVFIRYQINYIKTKVKIIRNIYLKFFQ